jgi:hypothetical protein
MSNGKFYFTALCLFVVVIGCKQKGIDKNEVLNDLAAYYATNKICFDSLALKLSDTTIGNSEISFIAARMKIKRNNKEYKKLYFRDWGISPENRSFSAKELGYGIDCGFFYLLQKREDYFENTRLIYKKISGNWYGYIYFN